MTDNQLLFVKEDSIVLREIGGEFVLIPIHQTGLDMQNLYMLNKTAEAVWGYLEQPQTLTGLVNLIQKRFEGSEGHIRKDVELLLQELVKIGFIKTIEA